MNNVQIINVEDKDYYDGVLWEVGIWPGSGYELDMFKVYASNEEEALEIVVSNCEIQNTYLLHTPDEIMDMIHEDFYNNDLIEYLNDNPESTDEDFIRDYLNYIYIDATEYGASQPYYIQGENLYIKRI